SSVSNCTDVHRSLTASPTRRSSDLAVVVEVARVGDHRARVRQEQFGYRGAVAGGEHDAAQRGPGLLGVQAQRLGEVGAGERLPRSEEHTSELQSRDNLVCRLLLVRK